MQAALAALAVELVTNRWSGPMRITLVGFGKELAVTDPAGSHVAARWLRRCPSCRAALPR